MRAAYGTFLSSLLMIKAHDMVADQAATKFNVTWTRTTPIVVSVYDDAYSTILTLECDHRFGMDVIGDPENILAFRYACSSAINPIEHWVMQTLFPGDDGRSITIGLGQMILNGEMVDMFMSNDYLVIMSSIENLYLVVDLETGIVRDVMITYMPMSGAYCFSDLQTEWTSELGEDLLSAISNLNSNLLNSVSSMVNSFAGIFIMFGSSDYGGWLTRNLMLPLLFPLMTTKLVETFRPGAIEEAERNGTLNLMSNYWDHLIEGLQKYYYDITPSQSDLEKEIPENLMSHPELTKDYNFIIFPYGGDEGDDTWLHYKVNRMPHNNDCWIIECSIVYYVGDKSYRETQYAVLLPGKTISMLYEATSIHLNLKYLKMNKEE
jgi:hypothetical protein